jgi:hypothetical protein
MTPAAAVASTMISSRRALTDVWRHAVLQMLDDYASVLRHEELERQPQCGRTSHGSVVTGARNDDFENAMTMTVCITSRSATISMNRASAEVRALRRPWPTRLVRHLPAGLSIYDTVQSMTPRSSAISYWAAPRRSEDCRMTSRRLGLGEGWSPPGLRRSGDTGWRGCLDVSNLRKGDSP